MPERSCRRHPLGDAEQPFGTVLPVQYLLLKSLTAGSLPLGLPLRQRRQPVQNLQKHLPQELAKGGRHGQGCHAKQR